MNLRADPSTSRAARLGPQARQRLRLLVLGSSFAAALALIVCFTARRYHEEAVAAGKVPYAHRANLSARLDRAPLPGRALVAWFGDSTILALGPGGSYPRRIAGRFPAIDSWIVAQAGLDPFGYYFAMGPVLERGPKAVVLIANPRLLGGRGARNVNDLAALLPADELLRASLLPMHARGGTAARLLLARLLRWEWTEDAMYFLEGLRQLWQGATLWTLAGPPGVPQEIAVHDYFRNYQQTLEAYDVPIAESTPEVQMLGAAVRMATARAVPALVVVTPIPWEELARKGWYHEAVYARRIAALRRVVVANNGAFLDLHRELGEQEFQDYGGHFNADGTAHLVRVVAPPLLDLVSASPQAP